MNRRRVLGTLGGVGVALLAGCSGSATDRSTEVYGPPEEEPTREPGDGLEVGEFDYTERDDGTLVVLVTVVNNGDAEARAELSATVKTDGKSDTRSVAVEVGPGESAEHELPFDFPASSFEDSGSLSLSLD